MWLYSFINHAFPMQCPKLAKEKQGDWHPASHLWFEYDQNVKAPVLPVVGNPPPKKILKHDSEGQEVAVRTNSLIKVLIETIRQWQNERDLDPRLTWRASSQSKCFARHELPADPAAVFGILRRDTSSLPLSCLNLQNSILCNPLTWKPSRVA